MLLPHLTVCLRATAVAMCLATPFVAEAASKKVDFVSSEWLKKNQSSVVIIDARPPAEYANGHIDGAVNVTWQMLSNMQPKQGEAGWGVILSKDALEKKLGSLGIDGKKTIVIYNNPAGLGEEGRVHWTLTIAGFSKLKVLNGGIKKWEACKYATTKNPASLPAATFHIAHYDTSLLATTDDVKKELGKAKLLDTRSPEEYRGETNHGENVGGKPANGRIPGSIPLCFADLYRPDGTILTVKEMDAKFKKLGLKKSDSIITYCTVGIRSGFVCQMLRHCGYTKARNYNASFSEWAGLGNQFEK